MNLHNAIRPTRLKSYQKPPPPPTPHFFKASGDIAFSTIPQGVLSICSVGGKMLWLLGRKINSIILSVNSGSTHLALFGVKLQTNIIITSAFDVKPDELAQYSIMTWQWQPQLSSWLICLRHHSLRSNLDGFLKWVLCDCGVWFLNQSS